MQETRYQKQNKRDLAKQSRIRVRVVAFIVAAFFIVGLLIPLRPKVSESEKRTLATFPEFSIASVADGSYFTELETWYAETYPLRDIMIKLSTKWQRLYGIRSTALYGDATAEADEIPDEAAVAPIMTDFEESTTSESEETSSDISVDEDAAAHIEEEEEEYEDGSIHAVPEEFGTIYIADGRGFGVYYFLQDGVDAYASMMNTVRLRLPDDVKLYAMPVPTGYGVFLDSEAQAQLGGSDMGKATEYFMSLLDPKIIKVPILQAEINHNAEYIYFNTDHHWTALGAYYAYIEYAKAAGLEPHDLSMFEKKTFEDFLGSYYYYSEQAQELANNKDTVEAYIPMGTNEMRFVDTEGNWYDWPIISDATNYADEGKYMCFIAGDRPFTEIHNPQINDGSAVLVIKESYGNAFVPFLVDHYQDVYVVDHRHYSGDLTSFIKENDIDDVIFMSHMAALTKGGAQSIINIFP